MTCSSMPGARCEGNASRWNFSRRSRPCAHLVCRPGSDLEHSSKWKVKRVVGERFRRLDDSRPAGDGGPLPGGYQAGLGTALPGDGVRDCNGNGMRRPVLVCRAGSRRLPPVRRRGASPPPRVRSQAVRRVRCEQGGDRVEFRAGAEWRRVAAREAERPARTHKPLHARGTRSGHDERLWPDRRA